MPAKPNPLIKALKIIQAVILSTSAVVAESVKKFYKKIQSAFKTRPKTKNRRGFNKPRVYRLRGYTTTSKVDKKVRAEQNQRLIRNFLVAAVFVLIIAILLIIYNPLKDIKELFRMIGI
ncbi:MAG: hypothetical protein ACYC5K_10680 [Saccharofermentanales bacterium]